MPFVRDANERAVVEQNVVLIARERLAGSSCARPPALFHAPWTGRIEHRLRRRADESRRAADNAHRHRLRRERPELQGRGLRQGAIAAVLQVVLTSARG